MSSYQLGDTIAAVGTAPGGAARAVVRLSGPEALRVLQAVVRPLQGSSWPVPQVARCHPGRIFLQGWDPPPEAWVWLWPPGRSYTRELMAEVHTWGFPLLAQELLEALCAQGARVAAPGEFTLRAFLHGRIDLTQAEAVLGVIQAQDPQTLQVALDQLAGGVGTRLAPLRHQLLELLAHVEAGLDFVEEDIQFITSQELEQSIVRILTELEQLRQEFTRRRVAGEAFRVVLRGRPNVGKSTLFRALSGQPALVSNLPGTTRDYLTASLRWGPFDVQLIDTAGAEETSQEKTSTEASLGPSISLQAQRLAQTQSQQADVVLLCLESGREPDAWEQAQLQAPDDMPRVVVWTKCDAVPRQPLLSAQKCRWPQVRTSAAAGQGLEELQAQVVQELQRLCAPGAVVVPATAARGAAALTQAIAALEEARRLVQRGEGQELVAAALRQALDQLGQILGTVYTDDILDRIFSRFCIGK